MKHFMFPRISFGKKTSDEKPVIGHRDNVILDIGLIALVEPHVAKYLDMESMAEVVCDGSIITLSKVIGNGSSFFCPLDLNEVAQFIYLREDSK